MCCLDFLYDGLQTWASSWLCSGRWWVWVLISAWIWTVFTVWGLVTSMDSSHLMVPVVLQDEGAYCLHYVCKYWGYLACSPGFLGTMGLKYEVSCVLMALLLETWDLLSALLLLSCCWQILSLLWCCSTDKYLTFDGQGGDWYGSYMTYVCGPAGDVQLSAVESTGSQMCMVLLGEVQDMSNVGDG